MIYVAVSPTRLTRTASVPSSLNIDATEVRLPAPVELESRSLVLQRPELLDWADMKSWGGGRALEPANASQARESLPVRQYREGSKTDLPDQAGMNGSDHAQPQANSRCWLGRLQRRQLRHRHGRGPLVKLGSQEPQETANSHTPLSLRAYPCNPSGEFGEFSNRAFSIRREDHTLGLRATLATWGKYQEVDSMLGRVLKIVRKKQGSPFGQPTTTTRLGPVAVKPSAPDGSKILKLKLRASDLVWANARGDTVAHSGSSPIRPSSVLVSSGKASRKSSKIMRDLSTL